MSRNLLGNTFVQSSVIDFFVVAGKSLKFREICISIPNLKMKVKLWIGGFLRLLYPSGILPHNTQNFDDMGRVKQKKYFPSSRRRISLNVRSQIICLPVPSKLDWVKIRSILAHEELQLDKVNTAKIVKNSILLRINVLLHS